MAGRGDVNFFDEFILFSSKNALGDRRNDRVDEHGCNLRRKKLFKREARIDKFLPKLRSFLRCFLVIIFRYFSRLFGVRKKQIRYFLNRTRKRELAF